MRSWQRKLKSFAGNAFSGNSEVSIIFGPIIAGPVERGEGRATVTVTILFEGDSRDLDAGRAAATLNAAVRPLLELGLQALPEWSFVPEHEHSPCGRMRGVAP